MKPTIHWTTEEYISQAIELLRTAYRRIDPTSDDYAALLNTCIDLGALIDRRCADGTARREAIR